MLTDVKKCSACGQDHDRLQLAELVNPVRLPGREEMGDFTYIYYCPVNGDEVFVRVTDQEPDAAA